MKPLGLSLLALMVLVPLTGCSPKESSAPKHITDNLQLFNSGKGVSQNGATRIT